MRGTGILAAGLALALAGCGSFDDPTLQEAYDPAKAAPPPARPGVPFAETRNLLWGDT